MKGICKSTGDCVIWELNRPVTIRNLRKLVVNKTTTHAENGYTLDSSFVRRELTEGALQTLARRVLYPSRGEGESGRKSQEVKAKCTLDTTTYDPYNTERSQHSRRPRRRSDPAPVVDAQSVPYRNDRNSTHELIIFSQTRSTIAHPEFRLKPPRRKHEIKETPSETVPKISSRKK